MIPSLSLAYVIWISQCSDLKITSNGSNISTLSRTMAQPPGRSIRSISTTIPTGCLHLQGQRISQCKHCHTYFLLSKLQSSPQTIYPWYDSSFLYPLSKEMEQYQCQKKKPFPLKRMLWNNNIHLQLASVLTWTDYFEQIPSYWPTSISLFFHLYQQL